MPVRRTGKSRQRFGIRQGVNLYGVRKPRDVAIHFVASLVAAINHLEVAVVGARSNVRRNYKRNGLCPQSCDNRLRRVPDAHYVARIREPRVRDESGRRRVEEEWPEDLLIVLDGGERDRGMRPRAGENRILGDRDRVRGRGPAENVRALRVAAERDLQASRMRTDRERIREKQLGLILRRAVLTDARYARERSGGIDDDDEDSG